MTRRDAAAVLLAWLGTATRIVVVSGTREVSVSVDELLEALR